MKKFDSINRPTHYAEGREIEPIDVIILKGETKNENKG